MFILFEWNPKTRDCFAPVQMSQSFWQEEKCLGSALGRSGIAGVMKCSFEVFACPLSLI